MIYVSTRQPAPAKCRTDTIPLEQNAMKSSRMEFHSENSKSRHHIEPYQSYNYTLRPLSSSADSFATCKEWHKQQTDEATMPVQPRMSNALAKNACHRRRLQRPAVLVRPSATASLPQTQNAYSVAKHALPEPEHKSRARAQIASRVSYAAALVCLPTVATIR